MLQMGELTKCLFSRNRGLASFVTVVVSNAEESGFAVVVPEARFALFLAVDRQASPKGWNNTKTQKSRVCLKS